MRFSPSVATGLFLASVLPAGAEFARDVRPFLETYCFQCHGPEKQKSGIRYDKIDGYQAAEQHLWTKVHEMLYTREMPPEDRPQPSAAKVTKVLEWIEAEQGALVTGSTRRLNRRELSGALQDLTGLHVDYAAGLPGDGTVNGFDTGAEALQDAGDSIAQVMEVSRRAVEGIRFLSQPSEKGLVLNFYDEPFERDIRRAFRDLEELGYHSRGKDAVGQAGEGIFVRARSVGERDKFSISVPPPPDKRGVLRFSFSVGAMKPMPELPNPHLWVQAGGKTLDYLEITNSYESPKTFSYEVQVEDLVVQKDGIEIALRVMVEVPYGADGFPNDEKSKPEEKIPGGTGLFRPKYDRKTVSWDEAPVPYLVFDRLEITPDYVALWPPAEWGANVGPPTDSPECARRLLHLWMERAYRRPVSDAEFEPMFSFYEGLRSRDLSFDRALRATFQSVLLSGPFRFLASPGDEDETIAQHAIASRLAFMFRAAPPDGELRRLAAAERLRDTAVLDTQIDRLLDDPRTREHFWEPFITQWLVLDQPITLAMDHIKKQDFRFGRYLKASMRAQTHRYIERVFTENRPARELVDSEWTVMNNILARHYGYDGIKGGHLRKVALRPDDPRGGGLLGHAGIQSMLCWMGDNWVIYRGAWALRHILDDPPPPPPLEVPELDPSAGENQGTPMRELLKQHQNDENCSVCHRKMDPLGFAFQNFDLSGRWRDVEYEKYHRYELDGKIEWRGEGESRPTDAAGKMPRGETFASFDEFKEMLVANYLPDLVRGLMKNFTLYATGRQPTVADVRAIRRIMAHHAKDDYPLREMLKALLTSEVFLGEN